MSQFQQLLNSQLPQMLSIVPSTAMICRCGRLYPSLWPVEIVFICRSWLSFAPVCATTQDSHVVSCDVVLASIRTVQGMAMCLQQETTLFWIPSAMVPMSGPGFNWPNLTGLKCDGYLLIRTGSCGSSLQKK